MTNQSIDELHFIRAQVRDHLYQGIMPFWANHGIDHEYGGYLTNLDDQGNLIQADTDKYIVTQTRMIWGMSVFSELLPNARQYLDFAKQGADFFIRNFWDRECGGWGWRVKRDGSVIDSGKVMYGQSFAIYALAQYSLSTKDARGLDYASQTFDLMQKYCADTARGGYYENLEPDWQLSDPGFCAGDRKSLDIHMHLLEAFTTLAQASGLEIHRRKLQEVIDLILEFMIDYENGCGRNQFDLSFHPIPSIAIRRTWNAERKGEAVSDPIDTTSYGHNLELCWLLLRAGEILGQLPSKYSETLRLLGEHALRWGIDWEFGGVYRDGPHNGPALVHEKEFWQNAEALVGLLDCYLTLSDERYLKAFKLCWKFVNQHMINHKQGEWLTLVSRTGDPLWADLGNPWKACYHTGRAMHEVLKRLDRII
jgi:mannobiose 2-epimerase